MSGEHEPGTGRPEVTVLLVEDDLIQRKSIRRAFAKRQITNPIRIAEDGIEALAILRGEDGQPPLRKPYLILLDLNLPRMNGLEFLRELRQDPAHCDAIVFVLTTSGEEEDRFQAYAMHVAGYIVKSDFGEGSMRVVDLLQHYWGTVEFPR